MHIDRFYNQSLGVSYLATVNMHAWRQLKLLTDLLVINSITVTIDML